MMDASSRVDLLVLTKPPQSWDGVPNPFLKLAHRQPSPSLVFVAGWPLISKLCFANGSIEPRTENGRRSRQPSRRVETVADVRLVLDAFFAQKARRMHELDLANSFSAPGTRAFIEAAATHEFSQAHPAVEFYACAAGEEIVAT